MSAMLGPDGRPAVFDGAAWVSEDRRYWWNGAAWQPLQKSRAGIPVVLPVVIVLLLGVAWFVFGFVIPKISPAQAAYGVTNAKIDSSTEIEFDYRSSTACSNLTFDYVFYDSNGQKVDEFQDDSGNAIEANHTYHFDIQANPGQSIDTNAVRFTASPTCHSS